MATMAAAAAAASSSSAAAAVVSSAPATIILSYVHVRRAVATSTPSTTFAPSTTSTTSAASIADDVRAATDMWSTCALVPPLPAIMTLASPVHALTAVDVPFDEQVPRYITAPTTWSLETLARKVMRRDGERVPHALRRAKPIDAAAVGAATTTTTTTASLAAAPAIATATTTATALAPPQPNATTALSIAVTSSAIASPAHAATSVDAQLEQARREQRQWLQDMTSMRTELANRAGASPRFALLHTDLGRLAAAPPDLTPASPRTPHSARMPHSPARSPLGVQSLTHATLARMGSQRSMRGGAAGGTSSTLLPPPAPPSPPTIPAPPLQESLDDGDDMLLHRSDAVQRDDDRGDDRGDDRDNDRLSGTSEQEDIDDVSDDGDDDDDEDDVNDEPDPANVGNILAHDARHDVAHLHESNGTLATSNGSNPSNAAHPPHAHAQAAAFTAAASFTTTTTPQPAPSLPDGFLPHLRITVSNRTRIVPLIATRHVPEVTLAWLFEQHGFGRDVHRAQQHQQHHQHHHTYHMRDRDTFIRLHAYGYVFQAVLKEDAAAAKAARTGGGRGGGATTANVSAAVKHKQSRKSRKATTDSSAPSHHRDHRPSAGRAANILAVKS